MRKSAVVKLTLVPILAASALAYAQAPGEAPMTLSPPGLTPTRVVPPCDEDPYADVRDDCKDSVLFHGHHGGLIMRGGFGGHFGFGGFGG